VAAHQPDARVTAVAGRLCCSHGVVGRVGQWSGSCGLLNHEFITPAMAPLTRERSLRDRIGLEDLIKSESRWTVVAGAVRGT
jgi:hypothetical protein